MPIAELQQAQSYYELAGAGDGKRVLMIAGSGGDLRSPPGPFAWPGAEAFSLLAYDHRGLGRSRDLADAQPTMDDFAGDALALADQLGWERFAVIGTSFGGMVAQELALRAGDRVERLALLCTSAGGRCGASYPLHELYALTPAQRLQTLVGLLDSRTEHDPELAAAIAGYLELDRSFAATEDAPTGLLRQLEARRRHDTCERLATLGVPTLVAAGRYDGLAPPARSTELARTIPGARLELFEGGHGFFLQDPTAWPTIAEFLRERP
jgi:3-oxoadipate enol-lactonase